jgi:hypothetical protein
MEKTEEMTSVGHERRNINLESIEGGLKSIRLAMFVRSSIYIYMYSKTNNVRF